MKSFIAFLAGLIFGAGLLVSGMTDTQKVIGFLDLFGDWDITLMFVMGSALLIGLPVFQWFLSHSQKPLLENSFSLPKNTVVDTKLISGAVIFGTGWGLYGYCPGPAIASLSALNWESFLFVGSMLAGMFVFQLTQKQAATS